MPKQRQTCTQCSMRRQKCDREIPCGRCVKRGDGDKCTRDWPKDGYDPKIHRAYPRPTKGDGFEDKDSREYPSPLEPSYKKVTPSVHHASSTDVRSNKSRPAGGGNGLSSKGLTRSQRAKSGAKPVEPPKEKILNFTSWGTTPLETFKLPPIEMQKEQRHEVLVDSLSDWNLSNGFETMSNTQVAFLQKLLPAPHLVEQLVEYHLSELAWCHTTIHVPTFREEFLQHSGGPDGVQIRDLDLRWVALLFAVMAGSMCCSKPEHTTSWDIKKSDRARLARYYFKATLTCLNLADYMWKHHIYSLQAICVLSLSGHLMGFSNTQTTLISAAIKIGQSLGLQRLGPEETVPSSPENYETIARVETGRRVWYQICIQDWFSIPFSEMYSIQKHHFTTIPPSNYDEDLLELLPGSVPTLASYLIHLQALGQIMSDCHDAVLFSRSDLEKHEAVLFHEAKINHWKDNLPFSIDSDFPVDPSWPPFATWTRRSLLICYSHKIMMLHRNFLGRSFSDPSFNTTRDACISAAKTIMHETRRSLEDDGPVFWIDHAFMVAAGITLCLDIFHRNSTDPQALEHRSLVERSIKILSQYEGSMVAARGIRLLSSLLTEQARTVATQSLENYNRSAAKRKRNPDPRDRLIAAHLPFDSGFEANKRPRQRFDIPRFVESLGGGEAYPSPRSNTIQVPEKSIVSGNQQSVDPSSLHDQPMTHSQMADLTTLRETRGSKVHSPYSIQDTPFQTQGQYTPNTDGADDSWDLDLNFELFEQIFPPQTGMSNSRLFEDLLNFDF